MAVYNVPGTDHLHPGRLIDYGTIQIVNSISNRSVGRSVVGQSVGRSVVGRSVGPHYSLN